MNKRKFTTTDKSIIIKEASSIGGPPKLVDNERQLSLRQRYTND